MHARSWLALSLPTLARHQGHAANGAIPRMVLHDRGMHRAVVLGARFTGRRKMETSEVVNDGSNCGQSHQADERPAHDRHRMGAMRRGFLALFEVLTRMVHPGQVWPVVRIGGHWCFSSAAGTALARSAPAARSRSPKLEPRRASARTCSRRTWRYERAESSSPRASPLPAEKAACAASKLCRACGSNSPLMIRNDCRAAVRRANASRTSYSAAFRGLECSHIGRQRMLRFAHFVAVACVQP